MNLPRGRFRTVYLDPPWNFKTYSAAGDGRSANQHYDCMNFAAIKALPVPDLLEPDSVVLMWVTDPMLEKGMELLNHWGLKFKTVGFYWTKLNADGSPFTGMGYWTRANPEQCWLATKGSPSRVHKDVRRWISSPRREHSRKPDEIYERIERLVPGPYLEMFARTERPGWTSWGNQVTKFASTV